MRIVHKRLIAGALPLPIVYLAAAFITLEPNPFAWSLEPRAVFALVVIFLTVWAPLYLFEDDKTWPQ